MATAQKGTWWRRLYDDLAANVLRMAAIAPTRTILVGQNSTSPLILTIDTADIEQASPTVTPRTANGSDVLYGVAHIETENVTVAVGANGRIENSTDQGLNWTSQTVSLLPALWDVVGVSGDQSRFVAAGHNSIWVQNQSAVWTRHWQGSQPWYGVAHKPSTGWCLVGPNGYVTTSPTALNGTFLTPFQITIYGLNKVKANSQMFMAVGGFGKIFRSETGASGSWNEVSLPGNPNLYNITPLDSDSTWAVIDTLGYIWYTENNGSTWTAIEERSLYYGASGLTASSDYRYGLAMGGRANFHVTYDQEQADYVQPDDVLQTAPPALNANDDMAGDAVGRLVTQFRG